MPVASGSVGTLGSGSFNIPNPDWATPSPKYQYEFTAGAFNSTQTLVEPAANTNPTQSAPPLPPVANTDTGGPP